MYIYIYEGGTSIRTTVSKGQPMKIGANDNKIGADGWTDAGRMSGRTADGRRTADCEWRTAHDGRTDGDGGRTDGGQRMDGGWWADRRQTACAWKAGGVRMAGGQTTVNISSAYTYIYMYIHVYIYILSAEIYAHTVTLLNQYAPTYWLKLPC